MPNSSTYLLLIINHTTNYLILKINFIKFYSKPSCNITSNDLNLLQSILQEQIAIGQHFFQNGSFVSGGEFYF